MMSKALVLRPRTASAVNVVVEPATQRKGKRRKIPNGGMIGNSSLSTYIRTLYDPWEHGPMELGYDTFIQTVTGIAFVRASFVPNADGSFGTYMLPTAKAMVRTNNSGLAGATWSNVDSTNVAAISGEMISARVVSGGIRVIVTYPETSAAGVLYSGAYASADPTLMLTQTPASLSNAASAEMGIGARGARAVLLPTDNRAFEFTTQPITGVAGGSQPATSSAYIVGTGWPTGTTVYIEAVLNLEGIPITVAAASTAAGVSYDTPDPSPGLMEAFPSPAVLFKEVRKAQLSAITMDAVQGLIGAVAPMAGRLLGFARSAFGTGRNFHQARLVAGANVDKAMKQDSLVIEEMKENGSWERLPQYQPAQRR